MLDVTQTCRKSLSLKVFQSKYKKIKDERNGNIIRDNNQIISGKCCISSTLGFSLVFVLYSFTLTTKDKR